VQLMAGLRRSITQGAATPSIRGRSWQGTPQGTSQWARCIGERPRVENRSFEGLSPATSRGHRCPALGVAPKPCRLGRSARPNRLVTVVLGLGREVLSLRLPSEIHNGRGPLFKAALKGAPPRLLANCSQNPGP